MRTSENKSVHKILLLFCGVVYNSNGLLGVTTARTGVDQVLHIPDLVHGVTRLPASSTNRAVDFGNKKNRHDKKPICVQQPTFAYAYGPRLSRVHGQRK
jgi:hypothetical protein